MDWQVDWRNEEAMDEWKYTCYIKGTGRDHVALVVQSSANWTTAMRGASGAFILGFIRLRLTLLGSKGPGIELFSNIFIRHH